MVFKFLIWILILPLHGSPLVTCSLGLVGNIVSMVVLCKKKMKSIFNHLLVALCSADFTFLLFNVFLALESLQLLASEDYWQYIQVILILSINKTKNIHSQVFLKVTDCVCHVSLAAGIFITISVSIERYQVHLKRHTLLISFYFTVFPGCFSSSHLPDQSPVWR